MKKECFIIGFGSYAEKETGEMMLRILLGIKSNSENYIGMMVAPPVYLKYSEDLEENLKEAINDSNIKTYYTTTDNIITGKTKVDNIIFE